MTILEKDSPIAKKYLYHVTFTKNVPNIKKKGLVQFQPSNWVKGPGGDRYNNDIAGIFAFDHPEDALNWAGKMEWEFRDKDKDMSIVRIDMEDFWEDDPAEDPFVSNKGKARYSNRNISADKIIDVLDMSGIKKPGDLGISRDEWLAQVSKKLTEFHGGGGVPDYTTMPAYGLKRARKGKNKFFVPKGEKLPAGVAAIKDAVENAWKVEIPTKSKRKMSKQNKDWSMLRTALESDLFEAGAGDCFLVAGRAMVDLTEEQEIHGMKMVHAYVYGQGKLKGRRFPHAWNEQGDVVLDNSNGNNIVMRKEQYYPLGGVVEEAGAYATYEKEKTMINMLKHSNWGPWDLNDSLDENIPDEMKEIGKENIRISKDELEKAKDELSLEENLNIEWKRFKLDVA
jgi:hypothetical protein